MEYNPVTSDVIDELLGIFGSDDVIVDKTLLEPYSIDESTITPHLPEVVVKPENTHEISLTMKLANARKIPVVARGGGTSLTGGTIPIFGGIVISFEKMDKIVELDEENLWLL